MNNIPFVFFLLHLSWKLFIFICLRSLLYAYGTIWLLLVCMLSLRAQAQEFFVCIVFDFKINQKQKRGKKVLCDQYKFMFICVNERKRRPFKYPFRQSHVLRAPIPFLSLHNRLNEQFLFLFRFENSLVSYQLLRSLDHQRFRFYFLNASQCLLSVSVCSRRGTTDCSNY